MLTDERRQEIAEHILYLILLPPEGAGQFSPFQGFSLNTLSVVETILHVCKLPSTITDLFYSRDEVVRWRAAGLGGYAIVLLDAEFLDGYVGGFPWSCLISGPGTRELVERHVAAKGRKGWLHLTTDDADSDVPKLWDFTRAKMYSWSRGLVEEMMAERPRVSSPVRPKLRPLAEWPDEPIALRTRSHNITLPTEIALGSIGLALAKGGEPLTGREDDEFARAIGDVANELNRVRRAATVDTHIVPGTPVLILTVPSVFRHLNPNHLAREAPRPVRNVVRNMLRQRQYIAMRASGQETAEILEDPLASGVMRFRAKELHAYTAALSVAAASLCAPALRLPPQVDRVRDLLIRLEGMFRGRTPNRERINRLARAIGESLRRSIPEPLLRMVEERRNEGIKLIGDTPLELLPIDDLPLGLCAVTSRMPTLPGNLLLRAGLLRTPVFLEPSDLKRILVVRAFDRGDPIRDHLVTAVQTVMSDNPHAAELHVVDVASKEDFLAAFNDFGGALAIFDGHGTHARTDPQGTIAIGQVRFNPFELYGKIRVPPVVFLSACETHTLEGIESSVASAFLFMGANAVLGTLVPINAAKAAVLIARFALRFNSFLPLLNVAIPWSQVVSGMLRMSYVTDILRTMMDRFSFGEDVYRTIHSQANMSINRFEPNWFERFLASLSEATSQPEAELRDL